MSPLVNKDFVNPTLNLDEEELERMFKAFKDNITTTTEENIEYE